MATWNSTGSCRFSKSELVSRVLRLGCQEGREYHCLLNQNGELGESCVPRMWIEPIHCPEFHTDVQSLGVYTCNQRHGTCPSSVYWSNTSFQYSGCRYIGTTQKASSNLIPVVVPLVLGVILVIAITIAMRIYRRRQQKRVFRNEEEYCLEEIRDPDDHEGIPLLELDENMLQKGILALEEHNQDTTYVRTQGVIWTTEVMLSNSVAVISGIVGSGKTKTALHTASKWKEEDEYRRLLLIESINEIPDVLKAELENVIIIMDDCFTRWTVESTEGSLSSTCAELYRRVCRSNNMKLIITIDHNIYQRHKQWLSQMDLFKEQLIITLPIEMAGQTVFTRARSNMEELLREERGKILQAHLQHYTQKLCQDSTRTISKVNSYFKMNSSDIQKVISRKYVHVGFPSVCCMFFRMCRKLALKIDFFLLSDLRIERMINMNPEELKEKQKRCILSYAIFKDKNIDLDELDLDLLNQLWIHYKLQPFNTEMLASVVHDMDKTFLIHVRSCMFKIADTVVYNTCMQYWIHKRQHAFLELCNATLIKENIRPVGYEPMPDEPIFVVKEAAHITHLAQRFKELLPTHPELKHHPMMANKEMGKDEQIREFADNPFN